MFNLILYIINLILFNVLFEKCPCAADILLFNAVTSIQS